MEPTTPFPNPVTPPPAVILGTLLAQLRHAANLITAEIKGLDPKTQPTSYQTFRWLGGAFVECEKRINAAAKVAELVPSPEGVEDFLFLQIPLMLANAEGRFLTAFDACKLDELPPGNPKEPEFERLLKIKWATNKSAQEALQNLGALSDALGSETYKLDLTESERAEAWRKVRRTKFEGIIADIEKQETELGKALLALDAAKCNALQQLKDNDQLTFDDIDPTKPVVLGEDESAEAAP